MAQKWYKDKRIWTGIILGVIILFLINNFWIGPKPYDFVSCTYNKFSCSGGGSTGWNGTCTDEIKQACCASIDYCGGQIVDNPNQCLHYYCPSSGKYCKPIYQISTTYIGDKWKCECATLEEYPFA